MEICKICSKKFDTKESLEQHAKAKHSQEEVKTSEKGRKKYYLLGLFVLALILFSYAIYVRAKKPGNYDDFAKCLAEKGAVIYGNNFCQYTTKQLNMFGKSSEYLNYVKCIDNEDLCNNKQVKITPTWEINGNIYEGVQGFEKLSAVSGCKV